jgi:hypothetical protein
MSTNIGIIFLVITAGGHLSYGVNMSDYFPVKHLCKLMNPFCMYAPHDKSAACTLMRLHSKLHVALNKGIALAVVNTCLSHIYSLLFSYQCNITRNNVWHNFPEFCIFHMYFNSVSRDKCSMVNARACFFTSR